MSDKQIEQVTKAISEESEQCERGVVAVRADGQAGIVLVAPRSLMLAVIFAPEIDPFDFWLN